MRDEGKIMKKSGGEKERDGRVRKGSDEEGNCIKEGRKVKGKEKEVGERRKDLEG